MQSVLTLCRKLDNVELLDLLGLGDVSGEVRVLRGNELVRKRQNKAHEQGVKVGPPPDAQTLLDLPISFIINVILCRISFVFWLVFMRFGDTELLVESSEEAFGIGFGGVEVSSRAMMVIRIDFKNTSGGSQRLERVGLPLEQVIAASNDTLFEKPLTACKRHWRLEE